MKTKFLRAAAVILCAAMVFSLAACSSGKIESESDKLRVVCTLFVPYDFVREIAGDRVDLTLLEVKHALDGEYDEGNHKSDILYNEYTKKDGIIREWLQHFESFEKYVHYFMFECFIRDGMSIDIISGEKIDEDQIIQYKEQYRLEKSGQIEKLSLIELLAMIIRLEAMILERTRRMEEYIKPDFQS